MEMLKHVAIIMDGNRRWAKKRGLPSYKGHAEGAENLERISDACLEMGIKYLTVYAFSTENWKRTAEEVDYLMKLFAKYIGEFEERIKGKNIRFKLLGDINGLNKELQDGINSIEEKTKNNDGLTVCMAINYGGRAEMINAAKNMLKDNINPDDIDEETFSKYLYTSDIPDPDLIVRTGGEQRLSGFLLWQAAYSELYFTDVLWPDFDKSELEKAVEEFNSRKRNFGK